MSQSNPRAELIEARVVAEEDFALEAWRARIPFPEMRRRALDVLGYTLSESALRALVKSARARHGDLSMTREERTERMQDELDDRMRRARFDLAKWHAAAQEPQPERSEYFDSIDYRDAVKAWATRVELANRMTVEADKRLAAAQKDERELHGLNAPTKIEAEVTTRDAVSAELDEMMRRLDVEPVEP